ncbi:MAG: hypothetical protein Q9M13_04410, partial [Mariprofundales bacterium]|nr:hypothetical protein [Mariprofundales bacterium]
MPLSINMLTNNHQIRYGISATTNLTVMPDSIRHPSPRHAGLDPASIFSTNHCTQKDGLRVKPAMTVCRGSPLITTFLVMPDSIRHPSPRH